MDGMTTDTADLVKELRELIADAEAHRIAVMDMPTLTAKKLADALSAKDAELAEAKADVQMHATSIRQLNHQCISLEARAESAESSLAQANERVRELEKNLEAQSTLATEMTQLAADYGYALERIDGFTMSQFAKIEDMLAACKLTAANALKTAAGKE